MQTRDSSLDSDCIHNPASSERSGGWLEGPSLALSQEYNPLKLGMFFRLWVYHVIPAAVSVYPTIAFNMTFRGSISRG